MTASRAWLRFGLGLVFMLLPAVSRADLTAAEWRADIRALAGALATIHRDPDRWVSRDSLERAVQDLDARVPALEPHQIVMGMARIAALLRDGHTRLTLPEGRGWATDYAHGSTALPRDSSLVFHHLPVRFWSYDDGLGIHAALPGEERLLGARVLRMAGLPADSALARMRPLVSADNELGWRFLGAARLSCVEALHAAGVTADPGPVRLEVVTRAGRSESVTLRPLRASGAANWKSLATLHRATRLADRHPDLFWWFAPAPGHDALFVQVNRIADTDTLRLVDFAGRLGRELDRTRPARVVLDLRASTGGDGQLLAPLIRALASSPAINRHGGLYVLIGRRTFSAAQMLVNHLELWTEALFAGEPTGATPSFYGDPRRVVLPNSGLTLRVSTVYWRDGTGNESRRSTAPDLPAPLTVAGDLAGGDPALDAALAHRPAADLRQQVDQLRASGGSNASVRRVLRALGDPAFTRAECDSAIAALQRGGR